MEHVARTVLAVIVVVYAGLQVDFNRRAGKTTDGEKKMLQYINVSMVIVASLTLLVSLASMFAPDAMKGVTGWFD